MKFRKHRFAAFCAAICMTAGSLVFPEQPVFLEPKSAEAKTIAEIDAEKKKKQNEIAAKQVELKSLANDLANQEKYQVVLQQEIDLINSKLLLIDSQLYNLNVDIETKQDEIAQLEVDITQQEKDVAQGLEDFKTRIRTLYIHGNDSILSALVGATDFYDVLAKIDLINRVAKHDDEMVEDLKEELETLSKNKEDLTARVQALNLKITETESVKKEFDDSRTELDSAIEKSTAYVEELEAEKQDAVQALNADQAALKNLEEERDRILLEEAKKAAEEEARRQAAAKKAAEEAARKAQAEKIAAQEAAKQEAAKKEAAKKKQTPTTTTAPVSKDGGKTTKTTTTTVVTTAPPKETQPPATQPYKGGRLSWPAPGFYHVSSEFGGRWGRNHNGIDIAGAGIQGSNACCAASGTVIKTYTSCGHNSKGFCGCNYGWGNYVVVDHGNGTQTLYAHLQHVSVSVGQKLNVGSVVGQIGSTGNSTGYHLHFGVIVNGGYVNPRNYLN